MTVRDEVEHLMSHLPRLKHDDDPKAIPGSGLYVFFEDTERYDQIVRVGTHRTDGGLPRRLRRHLRGSRRVSVFRRHLGSIVLFGDERLDRWMDRTAEKMPDVEAEVNRILRDHLEFSVLFVGDVDERTRLEASLIGTLARDPYMSTGWRGLRAARAAIRESGLWNVERIDFTGTVDLNGLQELVDRTNDRSPAMVSIEGK